MKSLAGPETQVLNLGKRTVIPGSIQTHYHLFTSAAAEYGPRVGLEDPSVQLKYANFTAFDEDFFMIPIEEIRDGISIVMTGLSGQIIYNLDE